MAKINLKQPDPDAQPKPTVTFDEPSIREHVSILHGLAAGIDGVLVVSAFHANPHGDTDAPGTVTHCRIGDVEGTVDAIMAHSATPHLNVFIGTQVMRAGLQRGQRGKESDIIAVLALVVDLDADTGLAGSMPVDPNYVLETSSGNYQPFLLLDRPLAPAEAKPLAAALKRASESDHGTADIAHVWRIPGTANWPNKKKLDRGRSPDPVAVTIAESWDGTLTSVDELREALAPWDKPTQSAANFAIGDLPMANDIRVSEGAAALLAANDVGDRSVHASKVVEKLAFDGMSVEQACALFLSPTGDWFSRYDHKDPMRDFERLWARFGARHAEQRAVGSHAADRLLKGRRAPPIAANDNRRLPTPPAMHPDPYAPSAAGGLIEEITKWITSTAIIKVDELSLAASLALMAGAFGSIALTPTLCGVGMYLTTIVKTAGGKGRPPSAIRALADKALSPGSVSNSDPTSFAAFERILRKNSSPVAVLDEFGLMLQGVNSKRQDPAAASIRKFLLIVYDRSNDMFDGKAYASAETKKDDSPIEGPSLTVLSMTTSETLYKGLSQDSVTDGFLNRFVFVEASENKDAIRPPDLTADNRPPMRLVEAIQKAILSFPAKAVQSGKSAKEKFRVPFYDGLGSAAHNAWNEIFLWQNDPSWAEVESKLRGRAAENTIRLATLRAISRNPYKPMVSVEDVQWGWAIVYRSIANMDSGVETMANSVQEQMRNAILKAIRDEGGIIYRSRLMRLATVKSIGTVQDYTSALSWLYMSGEVIDISKAGDGSKLQINSHEQEE
ncbi:DNA-primase RepB domain-containing protein [Rhizobium tumorigenes]|uniref:DNA-primase RepB domain-containing protein n=1 Tax=Rhizobium tumorigenes TaxID=2041385 RepID=UPI00241F6D1D|nr:DNA-primase RepB domain-containing protein [Rhizobium tumorigenes]WFS02791.1 DNA-primase RepB domain-containing protein [Rhizobium tumorigenes]